MPRTEAGGSSKSTDRWRGTDVCPFAVRHPRTLRHAARRRRLDGVRGPAEHLRARRDPGGSKFEGIGYDARTRNYYVSETTGGEIHRGQVNSPTAVEWLKGDGTDGRWTARGVNVDSQGRVYVAGGPNGIDHPGAPDLWVYGRDGKLLAALRTGVPDSFLNDIAIGPDGAAYFTNSNAPQIFRVAERHGRWTVSTWADATGSIQTADGFNLGGIVLSPDRRALVVAQGNVGKLWRFDLRTAKPTDPDRVLTTAKLAQGRLLVVDSKFDEATAVPPYQVITLDPRR
ncbi:sugar lactone lactonase YvrE [Kribbella aluminosa]|uniref:Sugar lactone lactonase YvrE n=1 Tax=Kribbella aluminosa TaxID=416017 RepID=A0ABS4UX69_9ACTN|nr:gluconolaconase [Kribbella aluminosa]MBP2356235.1 sugar lactone lactonase YvrE [Kribbella aluminosa]